MQIPKLLGRNQKEPESVEEKKKREEIDNNKQIMMTGPNRLRTDKVRIWIMKPVSIYSEKVIDPETKVETTRLRYKWGIISDFKFDITKKGFAGTFRFKGREYRCAIKEPAFYDIKGYPVVQWDIEGNRPISVKIDDIEQQKESAFAERVYGTKTLDRLFGALRGDQKTNWFMIIIMLVMGILAGIFIDHFAHI